MGSYKGYKSTNMGYSYNGYQDTQPTYIPPFIATHEPPSRITGKALN